MFDPDAYFSRIAYSGPREPTLAALQAVCRAQPRFIVYESLDPFLGHAPVLTTEALCDKLLRQKRGGYCFELNLLLRDALLSLGMRVTGLAARVVWMAPPDMPLRPRTHMLLKVEVEDVPGAFLVDAGFGGQLVDVPLLLEPGLEQQATFGLYRVTHDGALYAIEAQLPQGWMPMYRFTLEPHLDADYHPLNWFTATHPSSIFRYNLLLQNLTPGVRTGLFNDRLVTQRPGEPPQMRRITDAADLAQVLEEVFDLAPPAPAADIFARIPKGLDGFVVPGQ